MVTVRAALLVVVLLLVPLSSAHAYPTDGYTIWRIAGDGFSCTTGSCDGPVATNTEINPYGIAVDSHGNVFVADAHRIRRITPGGALETVAGGGTGCAAPTGACGDGPDA